MDVPTAAAVVKNLLSLGIVVGELRKCVNKYAALSTASSAPSDPSSARQVYWPRRRTTQIIKRKISDSIAENDRIPNSAKDGTANDTPVANTDSDTQVGDTDSLGLETLFPTFPKYLYDDSLLCLLASVDVDTRILNQQPLLRKTASHGGVPEAQNSKDSEAKSVIEQIVGFGKTSSICIEGSSALNITSVLDDITFLDDSEALNTQIVIRASSEHIMRALPTGAVDEISKYNMDNIDFSITVRAAQVPGQIDKCSLFLVVDRTVKGAGSNDGDFTGPGLTPPLLCLSLIPL